jgi:hypothetical protein
LDRVPFDRVIVLDHEFDHPAGGLPDPLCLVARDLKTGERITRWLDKGDPGPCPYDTGPGTLIIGHAINAECLCHRVLGWPLPTYTLCTYAETRAALNGSADGKAGLLVAAQRFRVPTITAADKDFGREIAKRGRAHADHHRGELFAYCGSDVDTGADLAIALLRRIFEREHGLAHALGRGAYMCALASVDETGISLDLDPFRLLEECRHEIRDDLIEGLDTGRTDCFVGGSFNRKRFTDLLDRLGLLGSWPKSPVLGTPTLEDEVFSERAALHPVLAPLYELVSTLNQLKRFDLPVGPDGRHRPKTWGAFGTNTGRNAARGFICAQSAWFRLFIRSRPGHALLYVDYRSQEPHVTAFLSGDPAMIEAVLSGDPYLWFAARVGLVPPEATRRSHGAYRDLILKPFYLSILYGAEAAGIAARIGRSVEFVEHQLLAPHRRLFRRFWEWSDGAFSAAFENACMVTPMGWPMQVTAKTGARSIRNHRIQAAGADILRLAVTALVANGVRVTAPVHDAVLCECPAGEVGTTREVIERVMLEASEVVIGHPIPVDFKVFLDRYVDGRGVEMYRRVMGLLGEITSKPLIPGSPIHASMPSSRARARAHV